MGNTTLSTALCAYTQTVATRVVQSDFTVLGDIAQALLFAKQRGATIFTAGNGGSAATASHMCNDLTKGCRAHGRTGFRTECLADSTAVLTCLANDFCYEDVFSIQLRTKAKAGDVFVVFSGSGNSPNIVRGLETAREMGLATIGFGGRDGGKMRPLCDLIMIAPTPSMEQLEDMHMLYEHALACTLHAQLEDLWGMELVRYPRRDVQIKTALFDFDGTISLIREGWQDIMVTYFIEVLTATGSGETPAEIATCARGFIDTLTGKQTVFQCIRLNEEVIKRGGAAVEPLVYKAEYVRRLDIHIKDRKDGLLSGSINPDTLLVPGCRELLRTLKESGIKCYLASGTDEDAVLQEAALLGLDGCFDGGIHGARDEMTECSKELVIKEMLSTGEILPEQLVSFGDGYVEIELVANLGGYTFGVASDEQRKKGISAWKRERLLAAGADVIIPDFAGYGELVSFITKGEQ